MGLASRRSTFLEFLINSGYADVTSYLRQTSPAVITRGKGNEQGKTAPGTLIAQMDGQDGAMNPLNPSSPFYTSLRTKNLPGRFGLEVARDFCTRTVASGWGTTDVVPIVGKPAPTAEPWTIGASVGDYNVNSGVAKHAMPVAGNTRFSYMAGLAGLGNCEIRADINIPTPLAGADFNRGGFLLRGETTSDAIWAYAALNRLGVMRIKIVELAGSGILDIALPFATNNVTLAVAVEGRMIFAKAYLAGSAEPYTWPYFVNMTSASADFGWVGCQSQSNTSDANVTITYDNIKVRNYRFAGEIVSLKPKVDLSHNVKDSALTMSTAIRRLAKPQAPLLSTLRRGVIRGSVQPVAYWPMEEGKDATQFTPLIGTAPITKNTSSINTSDLKSGVFSEFNCSDAIPVLNGILLNATIPSYSSPSQQLEIRLLFSVPDQLSAADNGASPFGVFVSSLPNPSYSDAEWDIIWYSPTSPGDPAYGWLAVFAVDKFGNILANTGPFDMPLVNRLNRIQFQLKQNGANVDWALNVAAKEDGSLAIRTSTGTSAFASTLGTAYAMQLGNIGFLKNYGIGHLAIYNQWLDTFNAGNEFMAWEEERAIDRFIRLCTEEGEPFCYQGTPGNVAANHTQKMGPQKLKTLLTHLQDCADTEQGELLESVTTGYLMFRTAEDLKNQNTKATIVYSSKQIGPGFEPEPDDKPTINDVTLKRDGGGTYQVEKSTGPMNTQRPGLDPNAAGRNSISPTFSIWADSQLPQIANFILLKGTNPEIRWPKVPVVFQAATIVGTDTELKVLATNIDDFFQVTNLITPWGVPDPLQLLAIGYTETWTNEFLQGISFNTAPYSPYRVFILDTNRLDTDTSTLTAGITNSATSFQVTDTSGSRWATTASEPAEFPFTIIVDGERMSVTAIAGAASPQTFTVVRSTNLVSNSHKAGAPVNVADPVYLG